MEWTQDIVTNLLKTKQLKIMTSKAFEKSCSEIKKTLKKMPDLKNDVVKANIDLDNGEYEIKLGDINVKFTYNDVRAEILGKKIWLSEATEKHIEEAVQDLIRKQVYI